MNNEIVRHIFNEKFTKEELVELLEASGCITEHLKTKSILLDALLIRFGFIS